MRRPGALLSKSDPIVKCKILHVWDMNETISAVTACYQIIRAIHSGTYHLSLVVPKDRCKLGTPSLFE